MQSPSTESAASTPTVPGGIFRRLADVLLEAAEFAQQAKTINGNFPNSSEASNFTCSENKSGLSLQDADKA